MSDRKESGWPTVVGAVLCGSLAFGSGYLSKSYEFSRENLTVPRETPLLDYYSPDLRTLDWKVMDADQDGLSELYLTRKSGDIGSEEFYKLEGESWSGGFESGYMPLTLRKVRFSHELNYVGEEK